MSKVEELRAQLDGIRARYRDDYTRVADELALAEYGAEVGATLVNDDNETFVVQSIKYSDANARVRRLDGVLSKNAHIEIAPDQNTMGWRRKDEA